MTLPRAMCQTVTVVRAGASVQDDYGSHAGPDTTTDVPQVSLQPMMGTASIELLGSNADQIVTRWRLFTPPGADIGSNDRVQQGANPLAPVSVSNPAVLDLQVDGDPSPWPGVDGLPHHVECFLKVWGG